MKTLAELLAGSKWGGENSELYPQYAGEGASKPGQAESAASSRMGSANASAATNATAQNGVLSQYEGDVQKSPMYKRMVMQGTQDTTTAYNQVRTKRAAMARRSGFGYASPIASTDASTVDQAEAGDIGKVGTNAMETLMPYQMQAAGMRGQNIGTYTNEGGNALNTWGNLEQQRKQRQMDMFAKIAQLGVQAATPHI